MKQISELWRILFRAELKESFAKEIARETFYIDICYTYISRNTAFQSKFNIFVVWSINTGIAANGKSTRGTKHDFMGCCVCLSPAFSYNNRIFVRIKTCKYDDTPRCVPAGVCDALKSKNACDAMHHFVTGLSQQNTQIPVNTPREDFCAWTFFSVTVRGSSKGFLDKKF